MKKQQQKILLAALSSAGCGVVTSTVALAGSPSFGIDPETGRTATETMVLEYADKNDYDILPLITAGDEVPLLHHGKGGKPDAKLKYRIAGAMDGMGVIEGKAYNWLVLQHEYDGDVTSPADFAKTVFSSNVSGFIPGSRISLLKLTRDWRVLGGTPLIREFLPTTLLKQDDGVTPRSAGGFIEIDAAKAEYRHTGYVPSSFCSGTLAETGFVDPDTGEPAPIWFASEEDDGYSGISWGVVIGSGKAYPVEGLGISEKEQTLPLRDHRPADAGRTIIVATDDEDDGEVYLWIGAPTADDPNGFKNGNLYVMKIPGADRESGLLDPASVVGGIGASSPVTWTLIPESDRTTLDGLIDYVSGDNGSGTTRGTSFLAPEDIDEDPNVSGRLYLAASGGADSAEYDGDGPRHENPLGRLYQIDLNINDPLDPSTWPSTITYLLEGGPGKGMSYDNVAATRAGAVLLAEDLNKDSDEADGVWNVLKSEQRYPVLTAYDTGTAGAEIVFELNMVRHDPQVDWERLNAFIDEGEEEEARDAEFWEASGMIEVPGESRGGKPAYLIGVQASSLVPSGVVEGGQVVLARPRGHRGHAR